MMAGESSRPQMEPRCRPEKAKDTELARSSGGTAREMMSTMEEGAMASPKPVMALRSRGGAVGLGLGGGKEGEVLVAVGVVLGCVEEEVSGRELGQARRAGQAWAGMVGSVCVCVCKHVRVCIPTDSTQIGMAVTLLAGKGETEVQQGRS